MPDKMVAYHIKRVMSQSTGMQTPPAITLNIGRGFLNDDGTFHELDEFAYDLTLDESAAYCLANPDSTVTRHQDLFIAMDAILRVAGQTPDGKLV